MGDFGFLRIAGAKAGFLLPLADKWNQLLWNALAKLENAGDGMSCRACHFKDHVYRLCVPKRRLKILETQYVERFQWLLGIMAGRAGYR